MIPQITITIEGPSKSGKSIWAQRILFFIKEYIQEGHEAFIKDEEKVILDSDESIEACFKELKPQDIQINTKESKK